MMISEETYYQINLKGKNENQIKKEIISLKKQIGHLKNVMENPEYHVEYLIDPAPDIRLQYCRKYLQKAKQALLETGAVYIPSNAEKRAVEFDNNILEIEKI